MKVTSLKQLAASIPPRSKCLQTLLWAHPVSYSYSICWRCLFLFFGVVTSAAGYDYITVTPIAPEEHQVGRDYGEHSGHYRAGDIAVIPLVVTLQEGTDGHTDIHLYWNANNNAADFLDYEPGEWVTTSGFECEWEITHAAPYGDPRLTIDLHSDTPITVSEGDILGYVHLDLLAADRYFAANSSPAYLDCNGCLPSGKCYCRDLEISVYPLYGDIYIDNTIDLADFRCLQLPIEGTGWCDPYAMMEAIYTEDWRERIVPRQLANLYHYAAFQRVHAKHKLFATDECESLDISKP